MFSFLYFDFLKSLVCSFLKVAVLIGQAKTRTRRPHGVTNRRKSSSGSVLHLSVPSHIYAFEEVSGHAPSLQFSLFVDSVR